MKRILYFILTLIFTNIGNWFFRGCEVSALETTIENQQTKSKIDSITISGQNFEILKLRQKDSLNQFFMNEKEKVLIDVRNKNNDLLKKFLKCEEWREDAKDGIVTDTVKVRKKLFGKGFKILR